MTTLVFDTETTGLPKSKFLNNDTLDSFPHVVQLSYIIYNTKTNIIEKIRDFIIKLPDNFVMSEECINIHGITNEMCQKKGVSIYEAIDEFIEDVNNASMVVAHNLEFDLKLINAEIMRILNNVQHDIDKKKYIDFKESLKTKKNLYCTMQDSIDTCNIKAYCKNGKEYVKFPKLVELHETLFQCTPKNLHNSLNDVIVCLRCFYKMIFNDDILNVNEDIKNLYERLLTK